MPEFTLPISLVSLQVFDFSKMCFLNTVWKESNRLNISWPLHLSSQDATLARPYKILLETDFLPDYSLYMNILFYKLYHLIPVAKTCIFISQHTKAKLKKTWFNQPFALWLLLSTQCYTKYKKKEVDLPLHGVLTLIFLSWHSGGRSPHPILKDVNL